MPAPHVVSDQGEMLPEPDVACIVGQAVLHRSESRWP